MTCDDGGVASAACGVWRARRSASCGVPAVCAMRRRDLSRCVRVSILQAVETRNEMRACGAMWRLSSAIQSERALTLSPYSPVAQSDIYMARRHVASACHEMLATCNYM